MNEYILDTCRYCGGQFKRKSSETYKFLCPKCYHERYKPISHLVSIKELNEHWDEHKHLLDDDKSKRYEFDCLYCGKHQKVLIEYSGNFMCAHCLKNEFYPRLEKYKLDFATLKNSWNFIINLENIFENIIINKQDQAKVICDNIFEFVLEKLNEKLLTNPFYVLNKKY